MTTPADLKSTMVTLFLRKVIAGYVPITLRLVVSPATVRARAFKHAMTRREIVVIKIADCDEGSQWPPKGDAGDHPILAKRNGRLPFRLTKIWFTEPSHVRWRLSVIRK